MSDTDSDNEENLYPKTKAQKEIIYSENEINEINEINKVNKVNKTKKKFVYEENLNISIEYISEIKTYDKTQTKRLIKSLNEDKIIESDDSIKSDLSFENHKPSKFNTNFNQNSINKNAHFKILKHILFYPFLYSSNIEIGQGGFSKVFSDVYKSGNLKVARKYIKAFSLEGFIKEIKILSRIRHLKIHIFYGCIVEDFDEILSSIIKSLKTQTWRYHYENIDSLKLKNFYFLLITIENVQIVYSHFSDKNIVENLYSCFEFDANENKNKLKFKLLLSKLSSIGIYFIYNNFVYSIIITIVVQIIFSIFID